MRQRASVDADISPRSVRCLRSVAEPVNQSNGLIHELSYQSALRDALPSRLWGEGAHRIPMVQLGIKWHDR
jgi:hypothetical protein